MNWVRSSYSAGSRSNWSTIFVLTVLVCVFVLPSDNSADKVIVAQQTGNSVATETPPNLDLIFSYSKVVVKYLITLGYILFAGSFVYSKYFKRKLKKI